MTPREITRDDLEGVAALLCEGFPRRTLHYWRSALDRLSARKAVEGFPRYGYLLEADGKPQGVMLVLTAEIDSVVRSNLSSWYVREPFRGSATYLFQCAMRAKGSVYLDLSPSEKVLPIVRAFGFKPYTNGVLLFTPKLLARPQGHCRVLPLPRGHDNAYSGFILQDEQGRMEAGYRIKWIKHVVPTAQFVCGDPRRLSAAAGAVSRALLLRGIPLAMVDAPFDFEPPPGIIAMPRREIRYSKRGEPPPVGDLRETELALFGP